MRHYAAISTFVLIVAMISFFTYWANKGEANWPTLWILLFLTVNWIVSLIFKTKARPPD